MTTNIALNTRSLNGIILISDGNGTEISEGNITTNDINSLTLTTNTLSSNSITCLGVFRSNTNGPYSVPTLVSSETGSLISYGNTSGSGATDFTNYGSTNNTLLQGFRFWNLNSTQTLFNLAIIDNTQTFFKSQLVGCTAETPLNPTSIVNKTYVDNNFVDKTTNQSIAGNKTFTGFLITNNLTADVVSGTQNIYTNNTTGIINLGTGFTTGTLNIGSATSNTNIKSVLTIFDKNTPFTNTLQINQTGAIANYISYAGPTASTNHIFITYNTTNTAKNSLTITNTAITINNDATIFNARAIRSTSPATATNVFFDNMTTGTLTIGSLTSFIINNSTTTLNRQNTFNNFAPISNTAPTISTHLTTKNYTDITFQTIANMLNYVDISTYQSIAGNKTFLGETSFNTWVNLNFRTRFFDLNGLGNFTQMYMIGGNEFILAPNANGDLISFYCKDAILGQLQTFKSSALGNTSFVPFTASSTSTFNGQATFNNSTPICSVATPTANDHLTRKDYIDSNFIFKTGNVIESINGAKTFLNAINCQGGISLTVSNSAVFHGTTSFNAQTYFINNPPISYITPTISDHLTRKGFTDATYQTIANMVNFVDITNIQTISGVKTFNSLPICSVIPTINTQLTNKLYVDNAVSSSSLLTTNNTWTGTNLFNNAVSMANTLTFSAPTINLNSSTTTHATNLFSLITTGTQTLWSNLSNNSVVNFFSSATSDVNLNINAKVKFRQVKLYNQVRNVSVTTTLAFPLEENILINSASNLTTTLPVITVNSLGLTFNFVKNNLLRTHTFTAQGTDTIVKNGSISGSTTQILMVDGITSFQLVILEMVSGSGLYNWVVINSSLPQTISNPIGSIIQMSFNINPPGYLLCDGTSYAISTHVELFNLIGYVYGGVFLTSFQVPDFRGMFLRGFGISGINANYVSSNIGTIQNDTIKAHSHDFTFQIPNNIAGGGSSRACEVSTSSYANTIPTQNQSLDAETKPVNFAVYYFIKY